MGEGLASGWDSTWFHFRAKCSSSFSALFTVCLFQIQILQLGGTEVGVALMSWRAQTPNFIMAMIPGGDCSLLAHPSSLPTEE